MAHNDRRGQTGQRGQESTDVMRLGTATDHYLAARRGEVARTTHRAIGYTLDRFTAHIGTDIALRAIKARHLQDWLAALTVSAASINHDLSVVRTFFRWALNETLISSDPTATVRAPKRPRSIPREIPSHVTTLLAALPDPRAKVVVSLEAHEGLRCGEVARLELGDIDPERQLLLVHGKGGHERWVPLSIPSARAITDYLAEWPAASGPLIRSYTTGLGVSPKWLSELVTRWMRDAGIKQRAYDGRSGHALRHTAAGALLDNGADLRDVSNFLGHATQATTTIYTKRRTATGALRSFLPDYSRVDILTAGGDAGSPEIGPRMAGSPPTNSTVDRIGTSFNDR